jgi:hypothetical protein
MMFWARQGARGQVEGMTEKVEAVFSKRSMLHEMLERQNRFNLKRLPL